tara:strand:- start:10366 stop:13461 length:3096 start_codon:yes stop_codon:yes gene_type:complete
MRIGHIADTHIRNLKYHYEYNEVFEQLYKSLRKEKVDCIVHCGDIAHTKTQISPEFVDMARDFFANLAAIAPTYIILGNHDGNLKNASRQDAITPIIKAMDNDNIHLLKDSGETKINDKFCLNVLSVFDEDNWVKPSDKEVVNIALYHGAIDRSKTDLNWTLGGDHDIGIFEPFDFAFLGDIHKTQKLDKEGRIWYAGSTVQQNFGESLDKGYLLWDIKSKDEFKNKLITFKNPKPFVTVTLNKDGSLPDIEVPPGARLRLVADSNISLDVMRKSVDVAKFKFKPENITYLNRASNSLVDVDAPALEQEDLRSLKVQNKLIGNYLSEYEVSDEIMDKVLSLNSRVNRLIEESEEVYRNVNWSIQSLEWDGLFNYGQGNKIDFTKLNGIVGIFGKNFSGKSSIVDSLLYAIYNSTSKSVRKNLNIINQNLDVGRATATIRVGDKEFEINRVSEKYVKKLKGISTEEAKTDVDFVSTDAIGNQESLNGTSRQDTDKNIRKYFGTLDDFLMTSMASQLDSLTFINEGSTNRKSILAKFLDLEIFDRKFKMAKEESADIRGALRRLEGTDFEDQIQQATQVLNEKYLRLAKNQKRCSKLESEISNLQEEVSLISAKVESAPTEFIDPVKLRREIENTSNTLNKIQVATNALNVEIEQSRDKHEKIVKFISEFDIGELEEKKKRIFENKDRLESLLLELKTTSEQKDFLISKNDLLCPKCKPLIEECIHQAQTDMSNLSVEINSMGESFNDIEQKRVIDHIQKFDLLKEKRVQLSESITTLQLSIDKSKSDAFREETILEKLTGKLKQYDDNREAIENLEQLLLEKSRISKSITSLRAECDSCISSTNDLFKEVGSAEQRIKNLEEKRKELEDLRSEFAAYELFMRCCHPNGISYNIIKNRLPVINEEIAKILTGVVDFEVFILNEDKKLDILIKHPKFEPRPLEMGSGAEKTIASMAIRLAFLTVSNLPKPDLFIMDEPGTALDEDNMEGFVRIMDMVKNYFKTVVLISHLDALKDAVDMQVMIDRKDGFAHIEI